LSVLLFRKTSKKTDYLGPEGFDWNHQ